MTLLDPITGSVLINVRTNDPTYSFQPQRSKDLLNWVDTELEVVEGDSEHGPDFTLLNITYEGDEPKMFVRVTSDTAG